MVEKVEWYDWQKTKEEALEEGREEGREEGKLEVAETLLAILEDEVIAESTKLPLSTIQELRRKKVVACNGVS